MATSPETDVLSHREVLLGIVDDETVIEIVVLVCLIRIDCQHGHDTDDSDALPEYVLDGIVHDIVVIGREREDAP